MASLCPGCTGQAQHIGGGVGQSGHPEVRGRRVGLKKGRFNDRDTDGKAFLQVGNLWRGDAAARRFVLARRFGRIAPELMRADSVRSYHDEAPFIRRPLQRAGRRADPMAPGPGLLTSGYRQDGHALDAPGGCGRRLGDNGLHPNAATAAGDATFHAGWTLHRAPGDLATTMRNPPVYSRERETE